jgi:hypothetical protein
MSIDPARTLAEHVCRTTFADLPDAAVIAAERDILDTLERCWGAASRQASPRSCSAPILIHVKTS